MSGALTVARTHPKTSMGARKGAKKAHKKGAVISRITVRGTDIFDFESDASLRKFPYTWINGLHIKTKETVIRRELLFKIGEKVDSFLLRETERNLRALPFITSARIAQFPQRDGTVALVVYVSDSWTTEPQVNLSGVNGVDSVEVGFKEKNLFGWGKTIQLFYNNGANFIERTYGYTDPRFLGSRWQLNANALRATDETNRNVRLERPFYSVDTKWSAFGSHQVGTQKIDQFQSQQLVSSFDQTKELNEVFAGLKLGSGRDIISRAGLRFRKENRNFERTDKTNPNVPVPGQSNFTTLFLDLEEVENDFVELTRLEKMTRIEDVNLGAQLHLSPGIDPTKDPDKNNSHRVEGSLEKKGLIKNTHLWSARWKYEGRDTFATPENVKQAVDFKMYHRTAEWSTLVVNTEMQWGKKLDPDNLIKLGLDNGLRSFEADSIVGTKSWLLNVENRFYFIEELWNLFSVGSAVFYDTGAAWERGHPIAFSDLKSEIGAGLRLGLTRSSNEVVLRLDFGYRMQKNKGDDPGFVFTFGTGQAF
jgi:hypothetical protein